MPKIAIKRCLISVYDKTNILELASFLAANNVELIATSGTFILLKKNNLPVVELSNFTGFPEIMDGRVKTLHPKIHGALLVIESDEQHLMQAKANEIKPIDLLIVNLYPFAATVASTNDSEKIIENIDIGGPAMIRSAAKNFAFKTTITNCSDYESFMQEFKKNQGTTTFEFRRMLAAKAFATIATYDLQISQWFNPDKSYLQLDLKQNLRYGENPQQTAKLLLNQLNQDKKLENSSEDHKKGSGIVGAKCIQGKELSYNNLLDADSAYSLLLEFNEPACVIVKHGNPCGVAIGKNPLESYKKALWCDPKSAFGGIVAINGEIDEELASNLSSMFFEVVIAKNLSDSAAKILATKKNLRILLPDFLSTNQMQLRSISGGYLMQQPDSTIFSVNDLELATKTKVEDEEIDELLFAMRVCKHVKSNAIVVSGNQQVFGLGVGQTSRVGACEIACQAAKNLIFSQNLSVKTDLYLASDAFFPFADNVEIAHKFGIKAIIAPRGSIRDQEVIAKANELGIALYFIKTRHFRH